MRTREEIEQGQKPIKLINTDTGQYEDYMPAPDSSKEVMLEVLLDIRDLLTSKQEDTRSNIETRLSCIENEIKKLKR